MDRVLFVRLDPVDHRGVDITEDYLVAGLCQDHADKTTSDVTCAKHNC